MRDRVELLMGTSEVLAEVRGVAHCNGVMDERPSVLHVDRGPGHLKVVKLHAENHLEVLANGRCLPSCPRQESD